jgi:hypothetical protein
MKRTLRLASSVLASVCGVIGFAALHEACTGVVLTPDGDSGKSDAAKMRADAPSDESSSGDAGSEASDDAEGIDGGGCGTLAGKLARWTTMDKADFYPWHYAGLDLGSAEAGITLDQAELVNCDGDPSDAAALDPWVYPPLTPGDGGACDPCGHCYRAVTWGTDQQVAFVYETAKNTVAELTLNAGYTGTLTFKGAPGSPQAGDTYVMGVGVLTKNGLPLKINWADPKLEALMEIFNGLMTTFTSTYKYFPDGYICTSDSSCLLYNDIVVDGHYWFGVRPLDIYFLFSPSGSIPTGILALGPGYVPESYLNDAGIDILDDAGDPILVCDGGTGG